MKKKLFNALAFIALCTLAQKNFAMVDDNNELTGQFGGSTKFMSLESNKSDMMNLESDAAMALEHKAMPLEHKMLPLEKGKVEGPYKIHVLRKHQMGLTEGDKTFIADGKYTPHKYKECGKSKTCILHLNEKKRGGYYINTEKPYYRTGTPDKNYIGYVEGSATEGKGFGGNTVTGVFKKREFKKPIMKTYKRKSSRGHITEKPAPILP